MEYKHSKGITEQLIKNGTDSTHPLPVTTSPYSECSIRDKKNPSLKCVHELCDDIFKVPTCELPPIFGICKLKFITWIGPYGEPIYDLRGVFDHCTELIYATSDYLKTLSVVEGKKVLFDMYGPEVYSKDTYDYFQNYSSLADLPISYFKKNSPLVRFLRYSKVVRVRIKTVVKTKRDKTGPEQIGFNIQSENTLNLYQNTAIRNLIEINSLELNKNFYIDNNSGKIDDIAESLGLLERPKKYSFGHASKLIEVIKN